MPASSVSGPSIAAFTSQYDQYLLRVRGSAVSTRKLHRYVTQRLLTSRFPTGVITWSDLRFSDCATFVRTEFARLPCRDTQQTWLMILRSLLRYLADEVGAIPRGWDTALPRIANRRHARLPRVGRRRRRPYVFSDEELGRLLQAPHQLRAVDERHRITLVTLMGLLASTGLRIGEALRLTFNDAKLDADPPHLLILDTKFGKSRVVVLHPSTADQLRIYLAANTTTGGGRAAAAFFTNRLGRRLNYITTRGTFRRLLHHAGIHAALGQRAPTLHSFRHTFAVSRLTQWHRERRNVQEWLPHLSVYLGHLGPASTYWYVSGTPALLQTAAELVNALGQEGDAQ